MTFRDVAAVVLTVLGVASATAGGFMVGQAAGFAVLGVGLFALGLLLGLS